MKLEPKKRMITGITPSGSLTLGNYLGVVKRLISYQNDYDLLVFIANLHAITNHQAVATLQTNTKQIAALYLAMGLDPKKTIIFRQSDVPAHSQLGWIMNTQTGMGELNRMTQYKEKSANKNQILSGLFTYPTLMAADILLYDSDLVPVGIDQKQHVELTRDLALRFNKKYQTKMFKIPEPLLTNDNFKIMDLQNPTKKMSKSSVNPKAIIYLLDNPKTIKQKINLAITDSENQIKYDPKNKPGVANLMTIHSLLTGTKIEELEKKWANKNYKELKNDVADAIIEELLPIQKKYNKIINDKNLELILKHGAKKATKIAAEKIKEVYKVMGLK